MAGLASFPSINAVIQFDGEAQTNARGRDLTRASEIAHVTGAAARLQRIRAAPGPERATPEREAARIGLTPGKHAPALVTTTVDERQANPFAGAGGLAVSNDGWVVVAARGAVCKLAGVHLTGPFRAARAPGTASRAA